MERTGTTNESMVIKVDPATGLVEGFPPIERNLSYMKNMFFDDKAYAALLAKGDAKV